MRRMRDKFEEAEEETGEINLVPYMDIVTNIIIFLLASVVHQVPLGTVNVSSPKFGEGGGGGEAPEPELNLTVTVGSSGFTLAGSGGVMPPIPKAPSGDYDYAALTAKLTEVRKEFYGGLTCVQPNKEQPETWSGCCCTFHPKDTTTRVCCKATFNADAGTAYDIVVKTLDAMREDKDGNHLFTDVGFAAGIL